ncbi:methylated-DNA--[protein]-cysteine S-methyltransferase [Ohtaekwangia koreensis]|jgi:methylated-DNA-[protein]-cysteine S-methyltransferase|uniref:Methylated-DNA--protein-cysteine methyltransferase n=1 Tax=Ohtaekwangia koreensis TaxID=688867 RepID=A0A1T5IJN2_9BACT|nr:methylated-DNA--[protein]-cysteine S-methyltransferase [Ohtaekwangia koreensis]SKC39320.1 methylated-DNA-[protein]-cysteine S-methyltransferase [Ohtaekwangia koreensis]
MKGIGYYSSPVGDFIIESENDKIITMNFLKNSREEEVRTAVIDQCINELDEYFFKGRKFFTVELDFRGSAFQVKVWNALMTIPYGKTVSYEEIALRVGDIKSIRAVGLANGQNPIAIIAPCHRVIGKSGDLVGYGGGLENKEWLLYHEGAILRQLSLF